MTSNDFIDPIVTNYKNDDYDFWVIYTASLVKEILPKELLEELLEGFEKGENSSLPRSYLHQIYLEIVQNSNMFLNFKTYFDILYYNGCELVWRSIYKRETGHVTIEINLRKQRFECNQVLH